MILKGLTSSAVQGFFEVKNTDILRTFYRNYKDFYCGILCAAVYYVAGTSYAEFFARKIIRGNFVRGILCTAFYTQHFIYVISCVECYMRHFICGSLSSSNLNNIGGLTNKEFCSFFAISNHIIWTKKWNMEGHVRSS